MTIDVLVAKAANIIHLRNRGPAVVILLTVPRILVDGVFYQAVRHIRVDGGGFLIADRVRHPAAGSTTRSTVVRVRARAALFLAVTTTVLRVEKIRDARVHKGINLLHTALDTVIVEISPGHARRSAPAGNAGAKFGTDNTAAHNGTQVLVIRHPFGFHILDPVTVRKDNLIELCRVQNGEVKSSGTLRNIGNQVHTGLELVAQGRDDD